MLDIAWFMKYTPTTFEEFVFENELTKSYVDKWIKTNYIDGNVLFYGPAGVGKTVFSELLIKKFITSSYDLKRIRSRSVTEVDELYAWCQKQPFSSVKKIVYIEEFDKLSNVALSTLKDTILEKFQEYVTFICTTNYINYIEYPLKTRFNYLINLKGDNFEGIHNRVTNILRLEKINFDEDRLKDYVFKNYSLGLRTLITKLQCRSISGVLNLDDNNEIKTLEENIVVNTMDIIKIVFNLKKIDDKKLVILNPLNSPIASSYSSITELSQFNSDDIDWVNVFTLLNRNINFLPVKLIINRYINDLENKRIPYLHYESFVYETIKCVLEITN